jgi:ATP-dependent DNA ligase
MARERIKSYVGPGKTIDPSMLWRYESGVHAGRWAAEEKLDGHWAEVWTNDQGVIYKLTSRTGLSFDAGDTQGVMGLQTPLFNSRLAGELECGTQLSNKRYAELKHRRIHLFDVLDLLGQSIIQLPYEKRRALLQLATQKFDTHIASRLLLVEQRRSNFTAFYNEILDRPYPWCGEGVVLKRLDSTYQAYNSDGKVDFWIRAKEKRTVDYFVMGIGKTPSGADNLDCGLWNGKKVVHILHVPFPSKYKAEDLVGKVIECEGWEVMESGALRSAHFIRIRNDKTKEMCTLGII